MIHFSKDICGDLNDARTREWLETNGLGGYASSTIVGLNTRRYHGLLVAATRPPVGRVVLLSKLEETLVIDGRRYDLSTNQYPGTIHPTGYEMQSSFRLDPFPIFTYRVENIEIEKSLFMIQNENSTVVQYQIRPVAPLDVSCTLELHPLVALRDYHSLKHEDGTITRDVKQENSIVSFKPYDDMPAIYFAHDANKVEATGFWYRNFEYSVERERGFDFTEDLFNPFVLKFDLGGRARVGVIASVEPRDVRRIDEYTEKERERRRHIAAMSPSDDEFVSALTCAADQFIVARSAQKTVIAGYHWFSDWGRDTMIALPGLALVTGRVEIAKSILLAFARYVDKGMLPNRFPDAGLGVRASCPPDAGEQSEYNTVDTTLLGAQPSCPPDAAEQPEYNTVDASLWFFEAVRSLLHYSNDWEFVRAKLYGVLKDIIDWHVRGTRYNIHVDQDGLLAAGEEGVQLTWMDAKVGDWVVTPRCGKPVEIQALWYNALRVMARLAHEFRDEAAMALYLEMAARARDSFNSQFWNSEAGCLFDVIDGEKRDASMRPNQIFAVSLHHTMLPIEKARLVVEAVERDLLTPYGLRSLAPSDPSYRGRYEGDALSRDGAYHQGTVWAWLIGPFITAYLRTFGESQAARQKAAALLTPFQEHLSEAGLNQISEIFDGDPPHRPGGCIAQAWSVAEVLRAASELRHSALD